MENDHRFCDQIGVKVGKTIITTLKSGKPFFTVFFNRPTFIQKGLEFKMPRKQDLITASKKTQYKSLSARD